MATAKQNLTDTSVQGRPDHRRREHNGSPTRRRGTDGDAAALRTDTSGSGHQASGDMAAAAEEIVRRCRAEQGLPEKITAPAVIARIVALLQPVVDD